MFIIKPHTQKYVLFNVDDFRTQKIKPMPFLMNSVFYFLVLWLIIIFFGFFNTYELYFFVDNIPQFPNTFKVFEEIL